MYVIHHAPYTTMQHTPYPLPISIQNVHSAKAWGWRVSETGHDWGALRDAIVDHIKGLNFGYRVQLREQGASVPFPLSPFPSHSLP
ncbi:hypothetical protein EON63_10265 [archaeon]|nr:MAG: hypothetical protein EON63_10265 [archaeon]